MGLQRLLVSDIDGTLVGDDAALRRFAAWHRPRQHRFPLVYSTGRSLTSLRELIARTDLPEPDVVVTSVGTEIYRGDQPFAGFVERIGTWDAETVRKVLAPLTWLQLQVPANQTPSKASFDAPGLLPEHLDAVRARLRADGLAVTLVYSADLHLDVLPPRMGKGEAALAVAAALGFERRQVLVFGDSGNDIELFRFGFRGTLVANALPELEAAAGPDAYRSPFRYADGVLDGIRHWRQHDVDRARAPRRGLQRRAGRSTSAALAS